MKLNAPGKQMLQLQDPRSRQSMQSYILTLIVLASQNVGTLLSVSAVPLCGASKEGCVAVEQFSSSQSLDRLGHRRYMKSDSAEILPSPSPSPSLPPPPARAVLAWIRTSTL